jgi:hypothetical protein
MMMPGSTVNPQLDTVKAFSFCISEVFLLAYRSIWLRSRYDSGRLQTDARPPGRFSTIGCTRLKFDETKHPEIQDHGI